MLPRPAQVRPQLRGGGPVCTVGHIQVVLAQAPAQAPREVSTHPQSQKRCQHYVAPRGAQPVAAAQAQRDHGGRWRVANAATQPFWLSVRCCIFCPDFCP